MLGTAPRKQKTNPPARADALAVVKPTGEVAWAHMSEGAGDNASPDEILAAVRAV